MTGLDESIRVSRNNEENVPTGAELEFDLEADIDLENHVKYDSEQSSSLENKTNVSKKKRQNECLGEDEEEEMVQEIKEEMDVGETDSESEKSPKEKSTRKLEKKRSREKLKRTQLLKNSSKKLRLETMSAGLEENIFSKYNVLSNSAVSPER